MKKLTLFITLLLVIVIVPFVLADGNSSTSNNSTVGGNSSTCSMPTCSGVYNTGSIDSNNCSIYSCPTNSTRSNSSTGDSNLCLENPDNYYDQETNNCYSGFSKDMIAKTCSDPDGGINKYSKAHTFGFRSVFADSRDQRIRTGGLDSCISNSQLIEHYCDDSGYIQTSYLECPNGCSEGKCIKGEEIKEKITCTFKGSTSENECYLAGQWTPKDQGSKWCKGTDSCTIDFTSDKGEKITWKSSCGGYQYTVQDGNEETITFDCTQGETSTTQVSETWFRNAYWQCYDGKESYEGGETSCKPYSLWKKYALSSCENLCSGETGKCGVNSFALTNTCYNEGQKPIAVTTTGVTSTNSDCEEYLKECDNGDKAICEKWQVNCQTKGEVSETKIDALICKDSCPLDGKCYPFGYRKSENYCSDSGKFEQQISGDNKCENNFECSSNVCVSGQCVSEGLMNKILNWFKRVFGSE